MADAADIRTREADRRLADPAAVIDDLAAGLGPEGAAIYALLANRDPERVPALIAALPLAVRNSILSLDLAARRLDGLPGRFLILHGRDDPIVPASESASLARALPAERTALYVLDSLNHVEPQPAGLADRLRLLAAIDRVLAWRDGA